MILSLFIDSQNLTLFTFPIKKKHIVKKPPQSDDSKSLIPKPKQLSYLQESWPHHGHKETLIEQVQEVFLDGMVCDLVDNIILEALS